MYIVVQQVVLILRDYHLTSLLLRPGIKTGKHCCPQYRTYKHLKAMSLVYYLEAAGRKLFSWEESFISSQVLHYNLNKYLNKLDFSISIAAAKRRSRSSIIKQLLAPARHTDIKKFYRYLENFFLFNC